jgi:hypothetical protein
MMSATLSDNKPLTIMSHIDGQFTLLSVVEQEKSDFIVLSHNAE